MIKQNYQQMLDDVIEQIESKRQADASFVKPCLLLHSCCGPCSSYVLEYLTQYFDITVLYYNPCIAPDVEYEHRKAVQKQLLSQMAEEGNPVGFLDCDYDHESFLQLVKGHENDIEGSGRCHLCYRQRLEFTADQANAGEYDYFCTTLTVSPYKNADVLNELGDEMSRSYAVQYLFSDFKKRDGYKRSIELSKEYNLYRQDYCGCEFSYRDGVCD